jgi:hypothetical protein
MVELKVGNWAVPLVGSLVENSVDGSDKEKDAWMVYNSAVKLVVKMAAPDTISSAMPEERI